VEPKEVVKVFSEKISTPLLSVGNIV